MSQHYIDETTLEVFGYKEREGLTPCDIPPLNHKWDTNAHAWVEDTVAMQAETEAAAEIARDEAMLTGKTYRLNTVDYQVSFTKDDGDGVFQAKGAIDLGETGTTLHFKNGTKMPIASAEMMAFATWFSAERNAFF